MEVFLRWMEGPLGSAVGAEEAAVLEEWVCRIFGYRLAQLGVMDWPGPDPLSNSPIGHKIILHAGPMGLPKASLIAEPSRLPFETQSIDLVILPHTLDYCADPQGVLREAERVLIADGRLVVMSFNPWSLWGVKRMLGGITRKPEFPWNANFIGYLRLGDWLSLLGLEVERTEVLMFRPPFRSEAMLRSSHFLESVGRRLWPVLAGVYMVQAVKRVPPLTLVRPRWHRLRHLGSGTLEPSTRGVPRVSGGDIH